ncbi:HNH endonuclease signature motif containing protein [Xanthobacter flavus]|uniref:HNH endonuclease signature motif containing protein n=1 Tax=Xanthobacter flavus TaxID=281 RepID=UPI0037286493
MNIRDQISHDRVLHLLAYDQKSGEFIWLLKRGCRAAGQRAGTRRSNGYIYIHIDGYWYSAHRLAWFYVNGEWPPDQIDHISGIRDDNRIANLRPATNRENHQNIGLKRVNRSGAQGVSWDSSRMKWLARMRINGVCTNLGRFESIEAASKAYMDAKAAHHHFQPTPRDPVSCGRADVPVTTITITPASEAATLRAAE